MMSGVPPIKLLSANELIEQANFNSNLDPSILVRGLKAAIPTNTPEEIEKIKTYQDDLRKVLSMERISRKQDRSRACLENGNIKIVKRTGKWSLFGKAKYLQPHEALFLMEINRLEIFNKEVIVSLEQAYHIFLRPKSDSSDERLTIAEYLVYSQFMRFGCNIKKFRGDVLPSPVDSEDNDVLKNPDSLEKPPTPNNLYVWNYLYELLGHRKTVVGTSNLNATEYNRVKTSMDGTIDEFRHQPQAESSTSTNFSIRRKRSIDCDSNTQFSRKSIKLNHEFSQDGQYFGSGSISDFMVGSEFDKFKEIFDKIDVIELKAADTFAADTKTDLRFSFDFWTSKDNTKPVTSEGPNFRIVIQESAELLPPNDEIFKLYSSLTHKAAIILICFNEELSFQAYIYRFTS